MIELKSIKSYNARDSKFNQAKSQVMFDKSKSIKFTSSCTCNDLSDNRLVIYLGLTNGSIVAITLYKKDASQTLNEYDDNFKLLSCYDQFKHKGPVSVLLSEKIDNTPIIFSGGADGTIKYSKTANFFMFITVGLKVLSIIIINKLIRKRIPMLPRQRNERYYVIFYKI